MKKKEIRGLRPFSPSFSGFSFLTFFDLLLILLRDVHEVSSDLLMQSSDGAYGICEYCGVLNNSGVVPAVIAPGDF